MPAQMHPIALDASLDSTPPQDPLCAQTVSQESTTAYLRPFPVSHAELVGTPLSRLPLVLYVKLARSTMTVTRRLFAWGVIKGLTQRRAKAAPMGVPLVHAGLLITTTTAVAVVRHLVHLAKSARFRT